MSRRLMVVIALICGAIAFLVVQGLGNATTFYKNADEAVASRGSLGVKRFRLQGVVVPQSIKDDGTGIAFDVEYHCAIVPVHHQGTQPALLKDGIPVVLEGSFAAGSTKTFDSDRIIIRHTEQYRTKQSQQAEQTDKERCTTS